ncbi:MULTISPECIES: hypothetical protein [Acinetobacter]|uniref:hypothetical protein n=1 Tax=Acinetobacter TaxID=469 RepID=UPI001F378CEA|nr:hypothetical protein [Acinetobacter junii]
MPFFNSDPAPTAATLSEYSEHGLNHVFVEAALILIHLCKTPQQYLVSLHLPLKNWDFQKGA